MMKEKLSLEKGRRGRTVFVVCNTLFLCLLMLIMVIPLWKVIVDSLDPTSVGIRLWPKQISFYAYRTILTKKSLYQPFLVSIYTTVAATAVGLLMTTLAAYVILQKEMPGRKLMIAYIMFTMLFSGGMIPAYLNIKNLGLMNNLLVIILPAGLSTYNMVLMRSFFESIPSTLYEAAELDGCTPLGIFWRIVLPLSKPALASIGLFIAVGTWNEYMPFILYMQDNNKMNFQVKVRELILQDALSGTAISASDDMLKSAVVVVVVFHFLVIYPFVQKYFTKGVTVGAVKG